MTRVLGYARACCVGGEYRPDDLPSLEDEVGRFHGILEALAQQAPIDAGTELRNGMSPSACFRGRWLTR